MMPNAGSGDSEDVRVVAVRERCPACPTAPVTAHLDFSPDEARATIFSGVVGLETCLTQTEARYRISFDRSRQKRGPPSQLPSLV
jgi:hypothetical protein